MDSAHTVVGDGPIPELPDRREGGAASLERNQARVILKGLISRLSDQERLAVVLRFERGMTAKQVAVALGIPNYKRVYEIQGRALAKLAKGLEAQGIALCDFLFEGTDSARGTGR